MEDVLASDGRKYDVRVKQLLTGNCKPSGIVDDDRGELFSAVGSVTLIESCTSEGNSIRVVVDCGSIWNRCQLEQG